MDCNGTQDCYNCNVGGCPYNQSADWGKTAPRPVEKVRSRKGPKGQILFYVDFEDKD